MEEMMMHAGTYFVPTLGLSHLNRGPEYAESEAERKWCEANPAPPDYAARAVVAAEAHAEGFKKALDAGVPIACGSDLALPDGGLLEMGQLVRRGMTEWQAIVAATKTSAEICLVDDVRGTIEPGKAADLVAVNSNPLDDIENGVIRPRFQDARIHVALNCGTLSCPPLAPCAFEEVTLDSTLDHLAEVMVNDGHHVYMMEGKLVVNEIFKWFEQDFVRDRGSLLKWIQNYSADAAIKALAADVVIEVYPYNWALAAH